MLLLGSVQVLAQCIPSRGVTVSSAVPSGQVLPISVAVPSVLQVTSAAVSSQVLPLVASVSVSPLSVLSHPVSSAIIPTESPVSSVIAIGNQSVSSADIPISTPTISPITIASQATSYQDLTIALPQVSTMLTVANQATSDQDLPLQGQVNSTLVISSHAALSQPLVTTYYGDTVIVISAVTTGSDPLPLALGIPSTEQVTAQAVSNAAIDVTINSSSLIVGGTAATRQNMDTADINNSDVCVILPVSLVYFDAVAENDKENKLSWITHSEINMLGYDIQASFDALNFETIHHEEAKGGKQITSYEYFHQGPFKEDKDIIYYRLKMLGNSIGDVSYSAIQFVTKLAANQLEISKVHPVPTDEKLTISIKGASASTSYILIVTDPLGNSVLSEEKIVHSDNIVLDVSSLSSGYYFLTVQQKGSSKKAVQKIVKM